VNIKHLSAFLLVCCGHAFCQDTLKYTLEDIFQLAASNSREVKISTLDKKESEFDLQAAKYNRLPQISGRASADYATNMPIYDNGLFHTPSQHDVIHFLYNTGADFYLNLYKGSQNELLIRDKQIRDELSAVKLKETVAQTKLTACFAFLELYRAYIFRNIIKEDIDDQKQQLKEISDLYKSGVVLHSDVLRIELELSKREYLLVEIENDIKRLNQKIQLIIGSESSKIIFPMIVQEQVRTDTFENSFLSARENAFSLRKSELMEKLSLLDVKKQRAQFMPQLSLEGSFTFANPQIFLFPYNASWYTLGIVGLKLRIPISNWYFNKPQMEKVKLEQLKEEEIHLHEEDKLKNELLNASLQYEEATVKRGICEKNIVLTQENLRIIKDKYFQSAALITDLLDANMNYLKSIFELETAKMNQLQYYYQIEFLKGSL